VGPAVLSGWGVEGVIIGRRGGRLEGPTGQPGDDSARGRTSRARLRMRFCAPRGGNAVDIYEYDDRANECDGGVTPFAALVGDTQAARNGSEKSVTL
jgi:hypothetical protein